MTQRASGAPAGISPGLLAASGQIPVAARSGKLGMAAGAGCDGGGAAGALITIWRRRRVTREDTAKLR